MTKLLKATFLSPLWLICFIFTTVFEIIIWLNCKIWVKLKWTSYLRHQYVKRTLAEFIYLFILQWNSSSGLENMASELSTALKPNENMSSPPDYLNPTSCSVHRFSICLLMSWSGGSQMKHRLTHRNYLVKQGNKLQLKTWR